MDQLIAKASEISEEQALGILQQSNDKFEVCCAMVKLGEERLFSTMGVPVAWLVLPKQKALKRITGEWLKHANLVMMPQTSRLDETVALDLNSRRLFNIAVDHTKDVITTLHINNGLSKISADRTETIPTIGIVGYDGFISQRTIYEAENEQFNVAITDRVQTTTADLIFASRTREALENIKGQKRIAVAETYAPIYQNFLDRVFPNHNIEVIGFKGGVEGRQSRIPDVNVIGDITDSGGSLAENGLRYVLHISRSAPVIVRHTRFQEHVEPVNGEIIDQLCRDLTAATKAAFSDCRIFNPEDVQRNTTDRAAMLERGRPMNVESLDEYLTRAGKPGVRPEADASKYFYGMPLSPGC